MRDFIRKITPTLLLERFRKFKKDKVNKDLEAQKTKGECITQAQLVQQFKAIGIVPGDILMVHSSMSKIGYLEEGPKTLVDALVECVGSSGHLFMPSSPVKALQKDHLRDQNVFDVEHTPSAMGAVTEYFRNLPEVKRSAHPTECVCGMGENVNEFLDDHFGQLTPYNLHSPWYKIMEQKGKILYIGVTLINSGTHLHVLEDLTDFKYPVYTEHTFESTVVRDGVSHQMHCYAHNPEFSKRRKCDDLIPLFEEKGVLKKVQIGKANSLLLNARLMLDTMLDAYKNQGITMYTPHGEKIKGYE